MPASGDCARSISHTFFAEGSATASERAVSEVPVDVKANETGTAPTSMLPADCIESRLTTSIFALCGSTVYAFVASISKSDANGVMRTLRWIANGDVVISCTTPSPRASGRGVGFERFEMRNVR
jgi:hypothetical protein